MSGERVRDAGDAAVLLELEAVVDPHVNAHAISIAAAVREARLDGVVDVVPTFRSVAVYVDAAAVNRTALRRLLDGAVRAAPGPVEGRKVEVPVVYGAGHGPDLELLASFAGVTADAVVDMHANQDYRVYMLGFLPGFPYMGTVDARIAAPRRAAPRARVPAGSVGIAGAQTGIYPRESPGGWQIVGRTPLELFDPRRAPCALLAPGDTVRFVPTVGAGFSRPKEQAEISGPTGRDITVVSPGLLTTVQDRGRWGHQATGVGVAGPMDIVSHDAANAAVGNDENAAALEITLAGPELRFESSSWIAVCGADLGATLDGSPLTAGQPREAQSGSVVRFGERRRGARTYLAVEGGIDVPPVLGSRSTLVSGGIGRALRAGDRLPLGRAAGGGARALEPPPLPSGGARLRVRPGPQRDQCSDEAFDLLRRVRFDVTPQSNRMAYRLGGPRLPVTGGGGMISDATFTGAIQITPSGEPILLMVDRQTTGGYPQIAVLEAADIARAGQLAPGDWVEFELSDGHDR